MQITKHTVANIEYTLKDDSGALIDSSQEGAPMPYVHGVGNLIPGLEKELEGKTSGDSLQVRIPPEEGYGERNENMIQTVPRKQLPPDADIQVGMQFHAQTDGGVLVVTVVGIEGEDVKLDGNHPLAGIALNFEVTVHEVRPATEEEISHGHAHGAGGHEH